MHLARARTRVHVISVSPMAEPFGHACRPRWKHTHTWYLNTLIHLIFMSESGELSGRLRAALILYIHTYSYIHYADRYVTRRALVLCLFYGLGLTMYMGFGFSVLINQRASKIGEIIVNCMTNSKGNAV